VILTFKILAAIVLFLLVAIVGAVVYIFMTVIALPKGANFVIAEVLAAPLPDPIRGRSGIARSQGHDIWYESREPQGAPKATILLIMGIADDALGWPPRFIDALTGAGYQVVRFDNRGTGLSDWSPRQSALSGSPETPEPYTLADMAADAVAVLDALDVRQAHIVGTSMGGMIAQQFALAHPERTISLTPIMSSAHVEDPELPQAPRRVTRELIKATIRYGLLGGVANGVRLQIAYRIILMGEARYVLNVRELAEVVAHNLRERRGYNLGSIRPHQRAVHLSGSRYEGLAGLTVPALVIHGKADPVLPVEHGIRLAQAIPGARSLWIDGMGHNIPDHLIGRLSQAMIEHFEAAAQGQGVDGVR
jgi:pimeloyl-ACP methyl ester carboxylesterase